MEAVSFRDALTAMNPTRSRPTTPASTRSAAEVISENMQALAEATVESHYSSDSRFKRYGAVGRVRCIEDAQYHLEFLVAALEAESIGQFVDYCGWAKILLNSRGIDVSHLIENLEHLRCALKSKLSRKQFSQVAEYLQAGIDALPDLPAHLPSYIAAERPHSEIANAYLNALLRFDRNRAVEIVLKESSRGLGVKDIYRHIITPTQQEIGRLWQLGKLTVVHEHYCTAATEVVMAELFRHLVPSGAPRELRLMAFCVEGERHCIGLRMFADLMSLEGWQVQYVGQDTPTSSVLRFIAAEKPAVVAVSVSVAKNVRSLTDLIQAVRAHPECSRVKVLIGGRAAGTELCKRVGADGYAECIGDAVELANRLVA